MGKWVLEYIKLIEEQENAFQQIEKIYKKYWFSSNVRKYYINNCLEKGDYSSALKVLDESILLDSDYEGLIIDYKKQKKDIYRILHNKEAYLEQLWELILKDDKYNLEIYKELKKQYSINEWVKLREKIFKNGDEKLMHQFYFEDQLYDRLMKVILSSYGLILLQNYESYLLKNYPTQILEKYYDEVEKMAKMPSDRKQYKSIVYLLKHMKTIENGHEVVNKIVDDWKERYKNRRAMMEELAKV